MPYPQPVRGTVLTPMEFDMRTDPIELIIESALNAAGIENREAHDVGLDFYLPSLWYIH